MRTSQMTIELYHDTKVGNDMKPHQDRWFRKTKKDKRDTHVRYNAELQSCRHLSRRKQDVYRHNGLTHQMQLHVQAVWSFVKEKKAVTNFEDTQRWGIFATSIGYVIRIQVRHVWKLYQTTGSSLQYEVDWLKSKEHRPNSHWLWRLSKAISSKRFGKVKTKFCLPDERYLQIITAHGPTATGIEKEKQSSHHTFGGWIWSPFGDYIAFLLANDDDIPPASNTLLVVDD